jgi:hypothetical protein
MDNLRCGIMVNLAHVHHGSSLTTFERARLKKNRCSHSAKLYEGEGGGERGKEMMGLSSPPDLP